MSFSSASTKPQPIPPAVVDAVCKALARTDLTMLFKLLRSLRMASIDRDDAAEIQDLPSYSAYVDDVDEILAALRELVEQENARPVMP